MRGQALEGLELEVADIGLQIDDLLVNVVSSKDRVVHALQDPLEAAAGSLLGPTAIAILKGLRSSSEQTRAGNGADPSSRASGLGA